LTSPVGHHFLLPGQKVIKNPSSFALFLLFIEFDKLTFHSSSQPIFDGTHARLQLSIKFEGLITNQIMQTTFSALIKGI